MSYANRRRASRREPDRTPKPRKAAPTPSGHQIAIFERPAYRRGEENPQLRVVVDAVEGGRPFASIRVWRQDRSSGEWWPTHAGVTVRLNEGKGVLDALDLAKDPAVVAEIHAHNRQVRQGQPGTNPPAATTASRPGPNPAPSRATAHEPIVGSVAPWNGPDRFVDPDATPASNPGFDEDPPF